MGSLFVVVPTLPRARWGTNIRVSSTRREIEIEKIFVRKIAAGEKGTWKKHTKGMVLARMKGVFL